MPIHPRRRLSARGLSTPWNRGLRGVPARAGAAALLALAAAGGCAPPPLADIDRQTDRLISAQSAELGRSSLAPDRAFREPRAYLNPRYRQAEAPTRNPAPEELTFEPADPDRNVDDVTEKLRRYSGEALAREGDEPLVLTYESALRTAQQSGREFLTAEENYILSAIRLLIERHLWSPRLFNDTSVFVEGVGDNGSYDSALNVINTLRVTQRIPFGGQVEAAWVTRATDQLRSAVSNGYEQSSRLVLSANFPLLRGAGLAAREDLIQAERNLIYAARNFERFRREFLVDISADYFDLLETQSAITNQERQIQGLERLQRRTESLFDSGRVAGFQVQTARSNLLRAQQSLESLRNQYILQLERFKVRLGLPVTQKIEVTPLDFALPEPATTPTEAALAALRYRLDLQNRADALDDARRSIQIARNGLLPDLDVTAEFGVPTDRGDSTGGLGFNAGDSDYSVGMTLGLPLDRKIERLNLRQAVIAFERAQRDYDQFQDTVIIEARQAIRNVELQRFQLELANQQVAINELRLRDLGLREDVDPQDVVDAEEDLLEAQNNRDQALTGVRLAVLNYLLATGQLRVRPDGLFQPLPGMEAGATPAG